MKIEKETVLPEVKRRKRKVPQSEHGITNISYRSLFELYLRECKKKGLVEETMQGYQHATRYFLDFAGHDLMCHDVTQDLINEYYLYLQEADNSSMQGDWRKFDYYTQLQIQMKIQRFLEKKHAQIIC